MKKVFFVEDSFVKGIIIIHDFNSNLEYTLRSHDILQLKYYEIQLKFIDEVQAINKLDSTTFH